MRRPRFLNEAAASREQLEADLVMAKSDHAYAKEALREEEAAAYASETGELKLNIDALSKAIPAIARLWLGTSRLALPRRTSVVCLNGHEFSGSRHACCLPVRRR